MESQGYVLQLFCSLQFWSYAGRLKRPRSVDQNKARKVLEERLIAHFPSPS